MQFRIWQTGKTPAVRVAGHREYLAGLGEVQRAVRLPGTTRQASRNRRRPPVGLEPGEGAARRGIGRTSPAPDQPPTAARCRAVPMMPPPTTIASNAAMGASITNSTGGQFLRSPLKE